MIQDGGKQNSRIPVFLICLYAAECVLGGSGRWLELGPVSIRMLLFAAAFVSSVPSIISSGKKLLCSPQMVSLYFLALFCIYGTVVGLAEKNPAAFIKADLTSLMSFAIVPCILAVFNTSRSTKVLADTVYYASVLLAAVTVVLHYILPFIGVMGAVRINDFLLPAQMGGLGRYDSGLFRVYFRSQIFLQFAAFIGMHKLMNSRGTRFVMFAAAEGLVFFAIILSFTRGFWLGITASAVLMFILIPKKGKYLLRAGFAGLAAFVVFVALSCIFYGKPAVIAEVAERLDINLVVLTADDTIDEDYFYDRFGINAEENLTAVQMRKQSLGVLRDKILSRPVKGFGLGENLDSVRNDGKAEYMYMDLMMKLGVFGLLAFLASVLCPAGRYMGLRLHGAGTTELSALLIAGMLGVCLTSTFNPFLTSPMGAVIVGLTSAVVETDRSES